MINALIKLLTWIVKKMPADPIRKALNGGFFDTIHSYAGYVSYFLPVKLMVNTLSVWASMMLLYLVFRIIKNHLIK